LAKNSPLSGRIGSRFGGRGARKRTRIIVATLFVILAGSFATTLAANVTISGGNALEFGQGQVPAIACDTEITSAITEEWNNTSTNFHVQKITLTGLNLASPSVTTNTSNQGCGGKTLSVSLLNTSGSSLPLGDASPSAITFVVPTVSSSPVTNLQGAIIAVTGTAGAADGSAIITLPSATPTIRATASAVARVVLETD
jgi:hypothetical protein